MTLLIVVVIPHKEPIIVMQIQDLLSTNYFFISIIIDQWILGLGKDYGVL